MRLAAALTVLSLAAATPALAKPPVVIELFTSQGCSACSRASEYVAELAERDGVLPLTFSVDYWDHLGWRDTFAKPEFTRRQRAYLQREANRAVYTPQLVIDGQAQAAAAEAEAVEKLIAEASRTRRDPPEVEFTQGGERVAVGSGPAPSGGADVWLVRYDPRGQEIEVRRGENRGKTITYRNVVKELVRLGGWSGKPTVFTLPEPDETGLETVIILQQARGGPMLALAQD